jgi:hypothetical protein
MSKPGHEEEKWHICHPLSVAEISQENQNDWIFRRDSHLSRNVATPLKSSLNGVVKTFRIASNDKRAASTDGWDQTSL